MGLREAAKRSTVTDWLLAGFTFVLAVVAIYQFVVMSGQLAVMRRDQRPWIKVKYTDIPMALSSDDVGEFQLVNIGKTPALNIESRAMFEFLDKDQKPSTVFKDHFGLDTAGILFPQSDDVKFKIKYISDGKLTKFVQDDLDSYQNGSKYRVMLLRVTYTDSTRTEYWTQYCSFEGNGPTSPAQDCTQYNGTDEN